MEKSPDKNTTPKLSKSQSENKITGRKAGECSAAKKNETIEQRGRRQSIFLVFKEKYNSFDMYVVVPFILYG